MIWTKSGMMFDNLITYNSTNTILIYFLYHHWRKNINFEHIFNISSNWFYMCFYVKTDII